MDLLTKDQDPRFPRHYAGQWRNANGLPITSADQTIRPLWEIRS